MYLDSIFNHYTTYKTKFNYFFLLLTNICSGINAILLEVRKKRTINSITESDTSVHKMAARVVNAEAVGPARKIAPIRLIRAEVFYATETHLNENAFETYGIEIGQVGFPDTSQAVSQCFTAFSLCPWL